jgi:serine/threonine protein kinase/tetratricopeptide (TPR) repeat protein
MDETQELIAGRYRLDAQIGRGGMGDVFKAADLHSGETVAIKRLHQAVVQENPDILDRFLREGDALRQLNHPHIVTIRDMVVEASQHYLVMEYVGGGSLRDLIDAQGRLPLEGVLNLALDLADALTRAHRLQIIHRDIKPDNVLLATDGTPRLTDFGVAHLSDRSRLTQAGSVIGTYAYLSPEACNGIELDERADIWSFGVMLFEMLTGRVPFQENSTAAILTAILTKPVPDLDRLRPGLPRPLIKLIDQMLQKDRDQRISSVRLVGAELEALIRGLDTPLRSLVLHAQKLETDGSRFATPSDEKDAAESPAAMQHADNVQTHGLSVYASPAPATPAITPVTGEYLAATNKWKWIALMVMAVALGCSAVLVAAILSGGARLPADEPSSPAALDVITQGERTGPSAWPELLPFDPQRYLVLVARFEALSGIGQMVAGRQTDVTRFVADNLENTLEDAVPFANIAVRRYPLEVTSEAQAQAVAAHYGATVIVWGNYTPGLIEAKAQIGVLDAFPYNHFDRALLERTANVQLHLTDARTESLAPAVLAVLNILLFADGDAFETMRIGAIQQAISVQPAPISGTGVAPLVHRYLFSSDPATASAALDEALALDASNPLLYAYASIFKQSQGRYEEARSDALTAQRLGPPDWVMPLLLLARVTQDGKTVFALFDQAIALRPDDWFPRFYRGAIYYLVAADRTIAREQARIDLDAAVSLQPDANFPYIFRVLLALHEGRLDDAFRDIEIVLTEFPDPGFMERLIQATFGDQLADPYALMLSAVANQMLGRHDRAIANTAAGLAILPDLADFYLIQGVSYCALGEYAAAETALSRGLMREPDFWLLYLLRADARLQQGDTEGAEADFRTLSGSPQAILYTSFVSSIQAGDVGCATLLMPQPSVTERTP